MSSDTRVANRKPFLWVMLLSASPFVLATLFYLFWKPVTINTVGVFLAPKAALTAPDLRDIGGLPASLQQSRGRWLLLMATQKRCETVCISTLYRIRQVRAAQGQYMDRIQRVWLATSGDDGEYRNAEADGVAVRFDPEGQLLDQLPVGEAGLDGAVYLIDPNGNLVMRYDATVDPVKMIREITRIIKINNGLG